MAKTRSSGASFLKLLKLSPTQGRTSISINGEDAASLSHPSLLLFLLHLAQQCQYMDGEGGAMKSNTELKINLSTKEGSLGGTTF